MGRPVLQIRVCRACDVRWRGTEDSRCWVCDGPSDPGPTLLIDEADWGRY